MAENIDIDLSGLMSGIGNLTGASDMVFKKVIKIAQASLPSAEKLGHYEFGFHSIGPTL